MIEILLPSTAQYDMLWKFNLYRKAEVREYWIVDPDARVVSVYTLDKGQYLAAAYGTDSTIKISVLEDCSIDMAAVFPTNP